MTDETARVKASLMEAFQLIRGLTEMTCDLTTLVTPLVLALENDGALGAAFLRKQKDTLNESLRLKLDSLAACDAAVERLSSV
ncbi:MAG: hypothetical protein WCB56_18610 [Terriglobales bacterium]|jgi:hypothetical protein